MFWPSLGGTFMIVSGFALYGEGATSDECFVHQLGDPAPGKADSAH
jgi:hypothetical protein